MGYNRSGKRRTQRMKRAKKDFERIAIKLIAASQTEKTAEAPETAKK